MELDKLIDQYAGFYPYHPDNTVDHEPSNMPEQPQPTQPPVQPPIQPSISPPIPPMDPVLQSPQPPMFPISPETLPVVPQLSPKMLAPVPYIPEHLPPSAQPPLPVMIHPVAQVPQTVSAPVHKSLLQQLFSGEYLVKTILVILFIVCVYLYFRKK